MRPTSYRCPTSHYTRQTCRTLISVCQSSGCYVIPAGWTFREGPGQKTQLMFPNGTREAFVPWIKGRTAGPLSHYSQSGTRIKNLRAIQALGGFQPLIRPSANPEYTSGRYPMDPEVESSLC